jgi:hypothetical protein
MKDWIAFWTGWLCMAVLAEAYTKHYHWMMAGMVAMILGGGFWIHEMVKEGN